MEAVGVAGEDMGRSLPLNLLSMMILVMSRDDCSQTFLKRRRGIAATILSA